MAFERITTIQVFQCLSTDIKQASGIAIGSRCKETDTGNVFVYDTSGKWKLDRSNTLTIGEYKDGVKEVNVLLEKCWLELRAANLANEIDVT